MWQDIVLKETATNLIARLSSRAFLGPELARNPDWIRITSNFATAFYNAGHDLRPYPYYVRKIAQWWLPNCRIAREMVAEGNRLIRPLVQQRREAKAAAKAAGNPIPKYEDAIEWCEQEAKGKFYDPVNIQFLFSLNSISTTADTLNQAMLDLAQRPEWFEPLRKEIVEVLSQGGWQKTSLFNMKLLDSFIKESQRLKPINSGESKYSPSKLQALQHHFSMRNGFTNAKNYSWNASYRYRTCQALGWSENPEGIKSRRYERVYAVRQCLGRPGPLRPSSLHADEADCGRRAPGPSRQH